MLKTFVLVDFVDLGVYGGEKNNPNELFSVF